ncbi:DNA repair protein [Gordonia phage Yeezy]|uniref:Uncharacterized protein n=1 Tax=Gordonia phage Yeezy TaxID=1821565 RepID=A0A142K9N2_9CAUD|nr:DNA repair protein [Gordonia phage Yeezy]AMS02815.1 hypothetical protein SEA_YEEZY_70 [Gordonia phage Yeezy]
MATERDMLDLLHKRYTSIRDFTIADRWTRAEHVPSALSSGYKLRRIADFIAADRYPGIPYGSKLAFHGHEVKVSRSDWLTELRAPDKAEAFKRYMHHWWLVVPSADIVREGELPEGWGLLVRSGTRLRAKVQAPRLTPEPMPEDLVMCLMGAAARTAHRDPLHHDAPSIRRPGGGRWCGFCGAPTPCAVHQPRILAMSGGADG